MTAQTSTLPTPATKGASHLVQVSLILGVVALVLGGSAVGIALTHVGPTGATGSQGSRGPAGPGAVVNETNDVGELSMSSCGSDPGSNITFTVTDPGTIVVTASASLSLQVTADSNVQATVFLWNHAASCSPNSNVVGFFPTSCSAGTCVYDPELSVLESFPVTSEGTYTISVAGSLNLVSSENYCYFEDATVIGVYYPS